ncbi:hypothetical protein [Noviherbaspirillum pedocola]|uniref:Secreted protein n=1 Tax=Noviherbaspirillum pedocola TaxID=2801341 RepID=A0A934W6E9_9BURK|nr:hypothetical protein [Noviherbaspirillum pedocola]MBK4733449.1 hypothetical protein [Noviherbaspirillum pedocola]
MKKRSGDRSLNGNTQLSHQTLCALFLCALIAIFPCHAEEKDPRPSIYKIEPSDICAMKSEHASTRFATPATPIDIIRNIKILINESPFIDRDFMNENNLSATFGDRNFRWIDHTATRRSVDMTTNTMFPNNCIRDSYAFWRKYGISKEKRESIFGIIASINDEIPECQSINVGNVKSIFGEPSAIQPIFGMSPPPHGRIIRYGPQTDPLGHTDIFYYFQSGNCKSEFRFTTLGSGVISGFRLTIEGDK